MVGCPELVESVIRDAIRRSTCTDRSSISRPCTAKSYVGARRRARQRWLATQ
jgi:hypothetical protein